MYTYTPIHTHIPTCWHTDTHDGTPIDWFWLRGWLIHKGAICTGTASLFWNSISLFERPRTRLVRKFGSQNQSIGNVLFALDIHINDIHMNTYLCLHIHRYIHVHSYVYIHTHRMGTHTMDTMPIVLFVFEIHVNTYSCVHIHRYMNTNMWTYSYTLTYRHIRWTPYLNRPVRPWCR